MTCLLNVYVLRFESGVLRRNLSRGTNHSSEPLRSHIEQLQASALSIVPSTSNATRPQWQLPLYFTCPPSTRSVAAISFAELDSEEFLLVGQPFHAVLLTRRSPDGLRHAIAAKLDSIAGGDAIESARGIQVLDRDLVGAGRAGDLEIRAL